MRLARSIAGSTGGKIVLSVLFAWLVFQTWTFLAAPVKLDPALETAARQGRVDISVELNFPPERFHILEMQEYGRLVGTTGQTIKLRRVPVEAVPEIARIYWVKSIKPLER